MKDFRAVIERHELHGGPDYNRGFRDCKASILGSFDHMADELIELDDIILWADGIRGTLGTEYADRVDPKEAYIAGLIWAGHCAFNGGQG